MKKLALLTFLFPLSLLAQEKTITQTFTIETEKSEEASFTIVDQMPEYPGGNEAMIQYLSSNIVYPDAMKKAGLQGTVFVGFIVEKDGIISEVKVLKGIGGGCDEEAVRVISEMPAWKPGMQEGKAVRVQYTLPIKYALTSMPKVDQEIPLSE